MALVLVTPATGPCVTVDEVKAHLRIDTTADDAMLLTMLMAAQADAENKTKRALMPQTWDLYLDEFPEGGVELPRPPLSSNSTDVTITYTVEDQSSTTLSSTGYTVDNMTEPGWVVPSYDNEWPDDALDAINCVKIRYVCGYPLSGASTATTPDAIKMWVKMRVGTMYASRESLSVSGGLQSMTELPRNYVDGLLDAYTVIKL